MCGSGALPRLTVAKTPVPAKPDLSAFGRRRSISEQRVSRRALYFICNEAIFQILKGIPRALIPVRLLHRMYRAAGVTQYTQGL